MSILLLVVHPVTGNSKHVGALEALDLDMGASISAA